MGYATHCRKCKIICRAIKCEISTTGDNGMIKAKSVLKNKFWIMEDDGVKIDTLHKNDDDQKYMYTCDTGTTFYETEKDLKTALGNITWSVGDISKDKSNKVKELYGYPTSSIPYNTMYDVQRRLPLFTKSAKSKSVYC